MEQSTQITSQRTRSRRPLLFTAGFMAAAMVGAGTVYAVMPGGGPAGKPIAKSNFTPVRATPSQAQTGNVPGMRVSDQQAQTIQSAPQHTGGKALADLVEKLLPAVVSIASTHDPRVARRGQTTANRNRNLRPPQGSPFEDLFKDYFRQRPGTPPHARGRQRVHH